ncbi:MAG: SpoIID/LytB domain-containing protein [Bradymonadia bacterium]
MIRFTCCFWLIVLSLSGCAERSEEHDSTVRSVFPPGERVVLGTVVDTLSGLPVAEVEVGWVGTNLEVQTDSDGQFELPRRPGFGHLYVRGDDLITTVSPPQPTIGVWRLRSEPALERAYLMKRPPLDSDPLDDPDLTERARQILAHNDFFRPDLPERAGRDFVRKQSVEAPATIRIYRRGPENNSCEGRVDVIPLEEYVRGVVPHEWIPSWHPESLRAGAIAARSYAWGWILAGGKYDCADLDDTTRSQVYEETRNVRADVAVMETTGVGIFDPDRGQVIRTEYSAENADPTEFGVCEPLCTGETLFGHGRGMCQWGTQRWASREVSQAQSDVLANCAVTSPPPIVGTGQIAEWMVSHYFPGKYTTELEAPEATLSLSQAMSRVGAFSCALPERQFGCADFVPEGPSMAIFDMFANQEIKLTYRVENTSTSDAEGVLWQMDVPGGVSIRGVTTSGAVTNTGDRLSIRFDGISGGETKGIEFNVMMTTTGRKRFRPFISEIQNLYDKRDWDTDPVLNVGQTYNGGNLRQLTEVDVYDAKTWDFTMDSTLNPMGWYSAEGQILSTAGGVRLEGDAEIEFESPHLYGLLNPVDTLLVSSEGEVNVAVRYNENDEFEPVGRGDGTRAFALSTNGEVFQIRLSGQAPFTIESVALRESLPSGGMPGDSGSDATQSEDASTMAMDRSVIDRLNDGGVGSDSGRGVIADAALGSPQQEEDSSCLCTQHTPGPKFGVLGALLLIGMLRRRPS